MSQNTAHQPLLTSEGGSEYLLVFTKFRHLTYKTPNTHALYGCMHYEVHTMDSALAVSSNKCGSNAVNRLRYQLYAFGHH